MRALGLVLAVLMVPASACKSSPRKTPPDRPLHAERTDAMAGKPERFDCAHMNRYSGHPELRGDECKEPLPDLWITTLSDGESLLWVGALTEAGVVVPRTGAAILGWMRRIQLLDHKAAKLEPVALALQYGRALPPGFSAADAEGKAASLALSPFVLVLERSEAGDSGGVPKPGAVQRATLRGTPDYAFTWTVERQDNPESPWQTTATMALESLPKSP